MNIYFCGIGGVGLGPLAQIARKAGYTIQGSDKESSLMTEQLTRQGVHITFTQDGDGLAAMHAKNPIDWVVYTAALPHDHPELERARQLGIKTSKRDELLAHIIAEKNLSMLAIAGTHGKTSTTSMLVWALKQLNIPISYSVGTTLTWADSGDFDPESKYFVYECDEFDRNFLHFSPAVSVITSIDYDHPDTYPTEAEYYDAFGQFTHQSDHTITWQYVVDKGVAIQSSSAWVLQASEQKNLALTGDVMRANATLLIKVCEHLGIADEARIIAALESFPGNQRRFEQLDTNLYTDYAHYPAEIKAAIQMAQEVNQRVVVAYQPHQNTRQHSIRADYTDCLEHAEHIYWLPTYLSREDTSLPLLTPEELMQTTTNKDAISATTLSVELWYTLQTHRKNGALVLILGAGDIDAWVRQHYNAL